MPSSRARTVSCRLHDGPADAVDTVELSLDGRRYELDVCEDHAEEVRDVVEEYAGAGRLVTVPRPRVAAGRRRA